MSVGSAFRNKKVMLCISTRYNIHRLLVLQLIRMYTLTEWVSPEINESMLSKEVVPG